MRLAGGIGEAAHAGDEALAVGVLADQPTVADDHAIDRTHQRRGITEAVQVGDDRELVRDGAVEAAKAHGARAGDGRGEVGGGDLDGEIAPVQAVMAEGGLDHGLGRVLGHGLAEAADQLLLEVERLAAWRSPATVTARRSPRPASSTAAWVQAPSGGRVMARSGPAASSSSTVRSKAAGSSRPVAPSVETIDLVHAAHLGLLLDSLQGVVLLHDAHGLDRVRARPLPAALGGIEEGGVAPDHVGVGQQALGHPDPVLERCRAECSQGQDDQRIGRHAGIVRAARSSS